MMIVLVTIVCLLLGIFIFRKNSDHPNLPPGSFGWPILGETVEFFFGKPENFVTHRMKTYSPDIFKTTILGEKTAVICGPAGHKFLFSNEHKIFTVFRPHSMQALFRSYKKTSSPPNDTNILRQPGFLKPEALMGFLGAMDHITQQQLKIHWEGKHVVKANPFTKTLTLSLACRFFMGIDDNPEWVARLVTRFDDVTLGMHSMVINFPGTVFYRANKAAMAIREELVAVIKERKAALIKGVSMRDILSHMIVVKDATGKCMPEAEIADKIMGLIVAGYSTTATVMTFFMKYIGLNPDVYDKIRTEQLVISSSKKPGEYLNWEDMNKMNYSWNVICETMRHIPPVQGTFREVLTEFTYAGYTVPKGWKVYWTVSTTNMNLRYFPNPDKFNPSRYGEGEVLIPFTYVPFGGGPRMCPGKEYARLAILTFVHNVVNKYRWDVLCPKEKVTGDMMPAPEKGLPIRLHPNGL
ncbi:hypothetical protein OSB04_019744 [Centaurea solstitialis]|uniref:ABC transmembrane type-2 domain-containing protein n=1 Tax=Centaurea solstitialis TaxID=347529 RepID=A0AA38T4C9_9ASTR|nr:hypothetical protein OSB04_019744 [Centaurea solstitialis]